MAEAQGRVEWDTVQKLFSIHGDLKEGGVWYPIEIRWYNVWASYAETNTERPTGPVDNSSLGHDEAPLKLRKDLVEDVDYKLVPQQVWEYLLSIYSGGPGFPRSVVTRGAMAEMAVDLHPTYFTVYLCGDDGQPVGDPKGVLLDSAQALDTLLEEPSTHSRLWMLDNEVWVHIDNPGNRISSYEFVGDTTLMIEYKPVSGEWARPYSERAFRDFSVGDELDAKDKVGKWYESLVREVKGGQVFVHYKGWASKWNEWLSVDDELRIAPKGTHTTGPYVPKRSTAKPISMGGAYASYNSSVSGAPVQRGIVGMRNLGNTCFMNSALQCLVATPSLVPYFTQGEWKQDLNPSNPLGWNGKVAKEYAGLVESVWSNDYSVVVPRGLKYAVGEFAPRFSGYNQQDSSELLSFLLDGIHEDLNRCKDKPYTSAVEDNGRHDSVVAEEAWETHLKRHDSIVVDTFMGQLKSRVRCPECSFVSITFDPFSSLSVPLPTSKEKLMPIHVALADPASPHRKVSIKVPKAGNVFQLKQALSKSTGLDIQTLIVGEIWKDKIYKLFPNNHLIGDIRSGDEVWCWETPSLLNEACQTELERSNQYSLTQLKMITTKEESSSSFLPLSKSERIAIPFTAPVPCVLPLGTRIPGSELWARVRDSMLPYLDPAIESAEDPFVLRVLEYGGRTVRQDVADDINIIVDIGRYTLAVDWLDTSRFNSVKKLDPVSSDNQETRVDIVPKTLALSNCLDTLVKEEELTDDNMWYCSKCKKHVKGLKKFDIWKLPPYLIVSLKRFTFSRMHRDKINTFVDFPLEGLDLSSYVLDERANPAIYDCYAVSNHMGGMGGGHYTAYTKSHVDNLWYELDDSRASVANVSSIKSQSAYILFYKLRNK